jgi:hypothetical protein
MEPEDSLIYDVLILSADIGENLYLYIPTDVQYAFSPKRIILAFRFDPITLQKYRDDIDRDRWLKANDL